jgi:DNA-directed RNA polymerase specialized sigma24 family protein
VSDAVGEFDEALARRVYAYFVFRLRQPDDAERLTRLTFNRLWERARWGREAEGQPDLPVFAMARAVIADNPRPRGASRVAAGRARNRDRGRTGLSNELAIAIGRLHGRERDALALRFGAELSIGEIAELLDRTPADVKQRLARGVRGLIALGVLPKQSRPPRSAAERTRARGPEEGKTEKGKPGDDGKGDA